MKKLLCTVLSTVLAMSSAAALNTSAYADSANTQQVSYNYWYNSSPLQDIPMKMCTHVKWKSLTAVLSQ